MVVEIDRVNEAFHMQALGTTNVPVNVDASPDIGGVKGGARPMELLLMRLGSHQDVLVVQILKKQKQVIETFRITIEADRVKDQIPSVFESITVCFKVKGAVTENKLIRAIELSRDKYCSVSAMLHHKVDIKYIYELNK